MEFSSNSRAQISFPTFVFKKKKFNDLNGKIDGEMNYFPYLQQSVIAITHKLIIFAGGKYQHNDQAVRNILA